MHDPLPCAVMIAATGICAYLPMAAILSGSLRLKEDILLVLFWYQSWIYLHLVPTINALFPTSSFARPARIGDMRAIQFTADDCEWYAILQTLVLLLFYVVLLYAYCRFRRNGGESRVEAKRRGEGVNPTLLIVLGLSYSAFGSIFYEVATRTGLLSPYAMSLDVFASIARSDHWIWRMYVVTNPFLLTVIMVAFVERDRRVSFGPALLAIAPGVALNVTWLLSNSRAILVFLILGFVGILTVRGHVQRPSKRTLVGLAAALCVMWYGLNVIPMLRKVVVDDRASLPDYMDALNPLREDKAPDVAGSGEIGFRIDGVELMALIAPRMLEIGPAFDSNYLISVIAPVLPIVPPLERALKFDAQTCDFKRFYLARYTDIPFDDYPSGALTDIFVAIGPLGFFLAALTYGWLFACLYKLISNRTSQWSGMLGIFLYFTISMYEFPFASLPFGWVRGLPVLLVVLLLNPFTARPKVAL
jgi:hypothetical protein